MGSPPPSTPPILVLGVGNLLLGDDGVGVLLARELARRPLPAQVQVMDGGTLGMALLPYLEGRQALVLLDAVRTADPPGSLRWLSLEEMSRFAAVPGVSLHEGNSAPLLAAGLLAGCLPPEVWVGAIAVAQVATGVGLSPALQRAFPELVAAVERFLLKIAVRPASGSRLP